MRNSNRHLPPPNRRPILAKYVRRQLHCCLHPQIQQQPRIQEQEEINRNQIYLDYSGKKRKGGKTSLVISIYRANEEAQHPHLAKVSMRLSQRVGGMKRRRRPRTCGAPLRLKRPGLRFRYYGNPPAPAPPLRISLREVSVNRRVYSHNRLDGRR